MKYSDFRGIFEGTDAEKNKKNQKNEGD